MTGRGRQAGRGERREEEEEEEEAHAVPGGEVRGAVGRFGVDHGGGAEDDGGEAEGHGELVAFESCGFRARLGGGLEGEDA